MRPSFVKRKKVSLNACKALLISATVTSNTFDAWRLNLMCIFEIYLRQLLQSIGVFASLFISYNHKYNREFCSVWAVEDLAQKSSIYM